MNLKKLLGDKYKEDMTLDEINEALKDLDMVSREEVPNLDDYVSKSQYDKASSDAASWKKKYRSTLDEAEQAKIKAEEDAQADKLELETLRKQVKVGEFTNEFLKRGYDEKLAQASATALYEGDHATVFKNLDMVLESTKKAAEKSLLESTPTPPTGAKGSVEKKPEDMSMDELQALIESNPDALS